MGGGELFKPSDKDETSQEQRQTKQLLEDLITEPGLKTDGKLFHVLRISVWIKLALLLTMSPSVSLSVCLQAVETNLASKDSHWVFVNEVRHGTLKPDSDRMNITGGRGE